MLLYLYQLHDIYKINDILKKINQTIEIVL